MSDLVNEDDPNVKLYGVSTGNGNNGVSQMFPDYYVWTDQPYRLAKAALVDTFKDGVGKDWALRHIEIEGESEYTIYAILSDPPCEETEDGEYPTLYYITNESGEYWSNDDGWTDQEHADKFTEEEQKTLDLPIGGDWEELELDDYEDGRNWQEYNGSWQILEVFPVKPEEIRDGKLVYSSIQDALTETVLKLVTED